MKTQDKTLSHDFILALFLLLLILDLCCFQCFYVEIEIQQIQEMWGILQES